MQRLHYTGDSLVVRDDVCEALLLYAAALASVQSSDIVTIPVVDELGSLVRAELLLGPASQIYATPVSGVAEIAPDAALLEDLRQRTAHLKPARAAVSAAEQSTTPDLDME